MLYMYITIRHFAIIICTKWSSYLIEPAREIDHVLPAVYLGEALLRRSPTHPPWGATADRRPTWVAATATSAGTPRPLVHVVAQWQSPIWKHTHIQQCGVWKSLYTVKFQKIRNHLCLNWFERKGRGLGIETMWCRALQEWCHGYQKKVRCFASSCWVLSLGLWSCRELSSVYVCGLYGTYWRRQHTLYLIGAAFT